MDEKIRTDVNPNNTMSDDYNKGFYDGVYVRGGISFLGSIAGVSLLAVGASTVVKWAVNKIRTIRQNHKTNKTIEL